MTLKTFNRNTDLPAGIIPTSSNINMDAPLEPTGTLSN